MPRLFFALWPDDTTREKLAAVADRLAPDCGRKVSKQNLHITLVFLGNVEDSRLDGLLAGVAGIHADNFSLRLDTIGWWKRPRILWLAPSTIPTGVSRLVSMLNACLKEAGFQLEDRPYRPHLTLARKVVKLASEIDFEPIQWNISHFSLIESNTLSEAVEYSVRDSWPLHPG